MKSGSTKKSRPPAAKTLRRTTAGNKVEAKALAAGDVVHIHKFALTEGIVARVVSKVHRTGEICVQGDPRYYWKNDYERDLPSAIASAERLKEVEIARLKRRLAWVLDKKIEVHS